MNHPIKIKTLGAQRKRLVLDFKTFVFENLWLLRENRISLRMKHFWLLGGEDQFEIQLSESEERVNLPHAEVSSYLRKWGNML